MAVHRFAVYWDARAARSKVRGVVAETSLPPLYDAAALPRVLSRAGALQLGYSASSINYHLAAGSWERILPRTYATVDALTETDRYTAALLYAGRESALSGAAALRVSGFRTVRVPVRALVIVPPDCRLRSREWVQIRPTDRPLETEQWTGPRRASIARSTADLALTMGCLDDVRALVATVVRSGRCSVEELKTELAHCPSQGSAHLRRTLREVGDSWSGPEIKAAAILRRSGLTGFVQNQRIVLPSGSTYVADFVWPELQAILEIDSVEFHLGVKEWRATMDRHLILTTLGYSVVHRPPSALGDEARFVAEIRAWLVGRGATFP